VNLDTGEWFWDGCRRHSCVVCGSKAAYLTALAIALAEPERFVRLSLVGDEWQQIRARMYRLTYDVRRAGFGWEMCYHVERNPRGTGFHVHAYQHGDYVPQSLLQELAMKNGMGYPDIRRWTERGVLGTMYGLKAATGYGMKGALKGETLGEYLKLNGGRFAHTTRAFWREGRNGRRLSGVGVARKVAVMRKFGCREAGGMWVLKAADA
jgi:hypothetical protein